MSAAFLPAYSASNRTDVKMLHDDMQALPEHEKVLGLIAVHACGLMLPRGLLRIGMAIVGLRGSHFKGCFLAEMYKRDRTAALTMWDQTCDHVLKGKDREDARSVGGWSQREIDLFLSVMAKIPALSPSPAVTEGSR